MRIPLLFGVLVISFESSKPLPRAMRREIKRVLFTDGRADIAKRILAVRKVRELTGCSLRDAVVYINRFFPADDQIEIS